MTDPGDCESADAQDARAHYGMIPDARLRLDLMLRGQYAGVMDFLMDTKTIHRGGARYRARAAQRTPCGAVRRRARDVAAEMEDKAREKDEEHNGVPRDSGRVGPVLAALRAFPPTQGVAWGAYGESSEHVETLVDAAARGLAEKRWRLMGARDMAEAIGYFKGMLWRRWGCNALFAAARLRVARMALVGLPAAAAARHALRDGDGLGDAWLGPTAFEADEAGVGTLRMARGAPVRPM